jgi:hypothetical protein
VCKRKRQKQNEDKKRKTTFSNDVLRSTVCTEEEKNEIFIRADSHEWRKENKCLTGMSNSTGKKKKWRDPSLWLISVTHKCNACLVIWFIWGKKKHMSLKNTHAHTTYTKDERKNEITIWVHWRFYSQYFWTQLMCLIYV